jgi:sugar phosphate isomerase/epimerase
MEQNRRTFLKTASSLGTGLALASLPGWLGCKAAAGGNRFYNDFGLQLYTLRDVLPKDPTGVLKQVADFGYKQIESYEGSKGMFWGLGNKGFKTLMDDLGMNIISSHCDIKKDFEKKAGEAAAIGMKYLICPWYGPQKSIDAFKKASDEFNKAGAICKSHGLRFAYHNHDYSFLPVDGQLPQDVMMQNTDKDLVDFEMDIYWVVAAGQDPVAWFNKYPGRFKLAHVKDRKKDEPLTNRDASCILGQGSINFKSIFDVADKKGLNYYIVEQEAYENTTPLQAAKEDADYMKNLKRA